MPERHRSRRFQLGALIEVLIQSKGRRKRGRLINFSEGGAFLAMRTDVGGRRRAQDHAEAPRRGGRALAHAGRRRVAQHSDRTSRTVSANGLRHLV